MKAYIILEDGHIFCGESFGAVDDVVGELVFTTGMGGYIETITDPSYYGQIVMQTFPQIGNYGMIEEDSESDSPRLFGYIVRDLCTDPSNFRCQSTLDEYLKKHNVVGICGVDTREITRIIREAGVMNAKITTTVPSDKPKDILEYRVKDAVSSVSCRTPFTAPAEGVKLCRVALLDFGAKRNIIRELTRRGAEVTVLPHDTDAETLLGYDKIMLSNGPGDPAENTQIIKNLKSVVGKRPIFGICLGHQLLALACGGSCEKLKYGHRGVNQPVRQIETGRVYISSQNHGYAVISGSLPKGARVSWTNANDGTCEGVEYPELSAFSVQFHPEACSGPHDTSFLFDKFISMGGAE